MRQIRVFVTEFLTRWESLALGVVAVGLAQLYVSMIGEEIPSWLYWLGAMVAVLIAAFRTWHAEHQKRTDLERQLDEQSHPRLEFRFEEVNTGVYGKDREKDRCVITLVASIRNLGVQSVCEGFSLRVISPLGDIYETTPHAVPANGININDVVGTSKHYSKEDFLVDKAITPIPRNGLIRGVLIFVCNNATQAMVVKQGSALEVSGRDAHGTLVQARYVYGKSSAERSYHPGMVASARALRESGN